ncbi:hypothetical protein L6164_002746 [Bauhinia variegata]|uniref:Uncharacterized protein n=1 Tax=Bauhinia variegata TaxID=167791 RepID=A0ACB9Q1T0_BAUVA|nr:hypothetical protein L6164_002746 [Bauhinia variegata]
MKAIGTKIKELGGGAFKGGEDWMQIRKQIMDLGHELVIVGGSLKFGVYRTDFGWGKLKKTEMAHVHTPGVISLADSKDEEGGIEVGLALPRVQMNNFNVILEQYLDLSKSIVSLP